MWSEDGQKCAVSYLQQPPVARQAVAHLFMPLDDHHGIPAMCHVYCLMCSVECCEKFLIVTFPQCIIALKQSLHCIWFHVYGIMILVYPVVGKLGNKGGA